MKLKTPHCEYLYVKVSKSRKQITYDVFDSSKKRTKHTQDSILSEFRLSLRIVSWVSFVRFLEESKTS